MSNRIKITAGDEYGRLTVIREVEPKVSGGHPQRCVECRCECGVVKEYRLYTLRNGNTQSCGCFARENYGANLRTHGLSDRPEYSIWQGMLHRCGNESNANHHNYGGRVISVCARWSESFVDFYEDMGPRTSSKHSIDRIDNDGNYSCGKCAECLKNGWTANCRWATSKEQARNKRASYLVEHSGETKCVSDWAEQYGINPSVLHTRLVKLGWTFEKSVRWPVFKGSLTRTRNPHYRVPMKERDASWRREHERLEVIRIARDRRELEACGDSLAKSHRLDVSEFKSRIDAALVEGWTWNGSVFRALREMGAVE